MIQITLRTEWAKLRHAVNQIESDLTCSNYPKPSSQMCDFLIAGEDHRFYHHPGMDPIALCRAVWKTFFCGSRQGASTIAMQLVRTITGRYEKTWRRKLIEIFFAILLTHHINKDRLPILYLWVAYYGWRMHNFTQACSRLNINPSSVSELEAAKLVSRLKYPEPCKLNTDRKRQIQYRAQHLIALTNSMAKSRCINQVDQNGTIQNCITFSKAH